MLRVFPLRCPYHFEEDAFVAGKQVARTTSWRSDSCCEGGDTDNALVT